VKTTKIILIILCGIALITFSCKQPCGINIENPDEIEPIDWENYNDVYSVFWNYFKNNCHGAGYPTGKTIKVYGRIDSNSLKITSEGLNPHGLHSFILMDEHEHEYNNIYNYLYEKYSYSAPHVEVFCFIPDEFQEKLTSTDLTRKCYIKGELGTSILKWDVDDECCFTTPNVRLYSTNDIYFE